jgi:hypothetical protein
MSKVSVSYQINKIYLATLESRYWFFPLHVTFIEFILSLNEDFFITGDTQSFLPARWPWNSSLLEQPDARRVRVRYCTLSDRRIPWGQDGVLLPLWDLQVSLLGEECVYLVRNAFTWWGMRLLGEEYVYLVRISFTWWEKS